MHRLGRCQGRRLEFLALAGLAALWGVQALVLLQPELRFTADSERDIFQVWALSHYGITPDSGILMAAPGWDLGPLYYYVLAPFNRLWPAPLTVQAVNAAIGILGLVGAHLWLRRAVGPAPALLAALLYVLSALHGALTDTIWHVGAVPGVALAALAAAGWWVETGRTAAMVAAAALLLLLFQLHALGMSYALVGLGALWLGRRHLDKKRLPLLLATAVVVALPMLLYLIPSLPHTGGSASRHGGGAAFRPGACWAALQTLARPRLLLAPVAGGWLLLGLAAVGVAGSVTSRTRSAPGGPAARLGFRRLLVLQLVAGFIAVSLVLTYEAVGRYFIPLAFPLVFLAAFGAGDVYAALARRLGRRGSALAVGGAVALLAAGGLASPTPGPEAGRDYLNAAEQYAATEYLVGTRGLSWARLRGRTHGVFFGPMTGIRYHERIFRDTRAATPPPDDGADHWLVFPEDVEAPAVEGRVAERVRVRAGTRALRLWRVRPAFDASEVRASGRRCPWPFPYLWSQSHVPLLDAIGYPRGHGPDIHGCLADPTRLDIEVPIREATELILQVSDSAQFTPGDEDALTATLDGIPVSWRGRQGVDKSWYRLTIPHAGTLHLVRPIRGALGFVDLF